MATTLFDAAPSSGGTVLLETLTFSKGSEADIKQGSATSTPPHDRSDEAPMPTGRAISAIPPSSTHRRIADQQDMRAPQQPRRHRPCPRDACRSTVREAPTRRQQPHALLVVDSSGNAVSNTTRYFPYGVGLVAEGNGVLLNQRTRRFHRSARASNAFGLVDSKPICPARESGIVVVSPTIVLKDGKPVLVERVRPAAASYISAVLQFVVDVLDYKMDVAAAVAAPRSI